MNLNTHDSPTQKYCDSDAYILHTPSRYSHKANYTTSANTPFTADASIFYAVTNNTCSSTLYLITYCYIQVYSNSNKCQAIFDFL